MSAQLCFDKTILSLIHYTYVPWTESISILVRSVQNVSCVLAALFFKCFMFKRTICLISIVATCPSTQLPALLFVCVLLLLFVDVYLENQGRTKGEGWSTTN